jgi:hypothetical protein
MFAFIACATLCIEMFHPHRGKDVLLYVLGFLKGKFPLFVFVGHGLGAYLKSDVTTNNETIMHARI